MGQAGANNARSNFSWVHAIADEAEEIVRKAAQNSFGRQFLKPLDREDDIDIDDVVVVRVTSVDG